jgi:hypothetical protein
MMQENDYTIIKPVDNLQNVGAMTPIDKHAQKRRQNRQPGHGSTADEQDLSNGNAGSGNNKDDQDSIDYRA